MLKLKEIERRLAQKRVHFYRAENGQGIVIEQPCEVLTEDSCFGYFDDKPKQELKEEFWYLKNDHRVLILSCAECCGCGDW